MKFYFVLFFMALLPLQANARVRVVDGDSLEIDTVKIRIAGIDSPEYFQQCWNGQGKAYDCGQEALKFMQKMVDDGQRRGEKVKCQKIDTDRYGRALSLCHIGKVDLNYEMVANGWAVAYRDSRYKEAENEARQAKRGIWQGKFMRPELYRILKKYQGEKNK